MARRRILGIVDSDSYVKWGAALLADLPPDWEVALTLVASRLAASDVQVAGALAGTPFRPADVPRATLLEIIARLRADPVDAVFVATSGAASEAVITALTLELSPRPVIMTGLPGISSPAKYKGLFRRAQADMFVLHSHREVREYRELAAQRGMTHTFGLATLPFLEHVRVHSAPVRDSIVFAAQPTIPFHREDRELVMGWLVETARAHPDLRVVVKVRALAGERQTHHERHPYAGLVPQDAPANLVVEGGSMAEHLARAVGFVTISSTAALEAIAADVPSIVLTDFGVSGALINEVFVGSGLLASSRDLIAARFHTVDPVWRAQNYFHPESENDWQERLEEFALLRDAGALPDRPSQRRSKGGWLRRAWDRKRAFGPHDHTLTGYIAAGIGYPYLIVRRRLRDLTRQRRDAVPGSEAPVAEASVTAPAGRG
ncbi:DUF6716 putative glycosyltransferase [Gryllotalpicola ginsengisoli]|uniref:DUF6716 putative glycosyltransferase n=1 Tax=Gryllotalpicola ginsengisoli TaxID=444608 RepID=UPI0003B509EE|nr:DUF6716 putative glycosyltransferase [Gryllotalpicola ginsengisoli]